MSDTIGALSVTLGLDSAKYTNGLRDAEEKTKSIGKSAERGFGGMESSAMKARGSLMLVSEELGVRIPRHLQRLIVAIPGVGAAFAAMLPLAGVAMAVRLLSKQLPTLRTWP